MVATKDGYGPATAGVDVVAGQQRDLRMVLTPNPAAQEQPTVVASTRIPRRIEEQAIPVEVIGRGSGRRKHVDDARATSRCCSTACAACARRSTSPELGLTMLRIRGLRGHYTRLLSDGVPLDWDRAGGLAPMQIPPMDLAQVEVLTDGASAIFGGNTLAGVVNLLSRRPDQTPNREFLFSQSAAGATDGVLWLSTPPDGNVEQHHPRRRTLSGRTRRR